MAKILVGKNAVFQEIKKFRVPEKDGNAPQDSSDLSVELASLVCHIKIISDCFRVAYPPKPHSHAIQQCMEIACHVSQKIQADNFSCREKGPAEPHKRVYPRFQPTEPHLVSYIESFSALFPVFPDHLVFTAHTSNGGVGKVLNDFLDPC